MPRYVALFRGINVGKAKRIAMADLRVLLAKLGYTQVVTLLNSGNVVFTGSTQPNSRHAARIREAVADELGVDAVVLVKSARQMAAIVSGNALAPVASDASRLLVALVQDDQQLAAVKKLMAEDWGDEKLHVGRQAAYLWCADGILESRALKKLLSGLVGQGTTRNWATLNKIHALMHEEST
jgi:uncharacterized protein (DUF1697 family)